MDLLRAILLECFYSSSKSPPPKRSDSGHGHELLIEGQLKGVVAVSDLGSNENVT